MESYFGFLASNKKAVKIDELRGSVFICLKVLHYAFSKLLTILIQGL